MVNKTGLFAGSFSFFIVLFALILGGHHPQQPPVIPQPHIQIPVLPPEPPRPKKIAVRLLVLRHTPGGMAQGDADLATAAARKAASEGLDIKVIGDEYIGGLSPERLKTFVSERMKKEALTGDTLIIHTIGHGFQGGGLQNLGQRADVMKAFAAAAGENNQKTLWWQLSCHATSSLPGIDTLPADQQQLFMMLASSRAEDTSSTVTQARLMGKVFSALAKDSDEIDPNHDKIITVEELKSYLNTLDRYQRGDLLFARRGDVFGGAGMYQFLLAAFTQHQTAEAISPMNGMPSIHMVQ
jgi:hypothetical protein